MSNNEKITVMFKYLLQIRTEVRELKLASKDVLTLKEVMDYTGFKKSYIYRLVSDGTISYSKPNGKAVFFERKVLERWLLSKASTSISKNEEKARKLLRKIN